MGMTTPAPPAYVWPATVPHCKKCGKNDRRYYGRGLCSPCYQWHHQRGLLSQFPLLPVHGNGGTDSWAASPVHSVVYRNHQRRRAEAQERQTRIWNTDGPLINPATCESLTTIAPLPKLWNHSPVQRAAWADDATRRAA